MEKFYFPMETMNVTQNWAGTTSHKPHWYNSTNYCDYPIDIAGADGGQSCVFAPCRMKVNAIKGIGSSMTNTIWLESVDKVQTPSGVMKVFMALTHWNDNDPFIKKLSVGSIVKERDIICCEGTDGCTANHIHLVCGNADKGTGNGLIKNSNGAWVSNGYCMKPEELMYINDSFTKCKNSGGLVFKSMPTQDAYLPSRGYFTKGDKDEKVAQICNFFTAGLAGDCFGDYLEACVKVMQKQNGLEQDGCIGEKTLEVMRKNGFKF